MINLFDGLTERRELIEGMLLNLTGYLLVRRLVHDGGGTDVETFEYKGFNFICTIQPIDRRPDDNFIGHTGDAVVEQSDLRLVYPATITLNQEDRVQVNDRIYILRNAYDNVATAMTNRMYVTILPDRVAFPPTLVP